MPEHYITATSEEEVIQQFKQHLLNRDFLEYSAIIIQGQRKTVLDIDIDLGGGFESGYETTTLSAPLLNTPVCRFAIHEEHFTDEIGKFFGMQDVEIGYPEFDKKFIIKTDDPLIIKEIFKDEWVRAVFKSFENFTLGTTRHNIGDTSVKADFLEFSVETGITDPATLGELYKAFYNVLVSTDPINESPIDVV